MTAPLPVADMASYLAATGWRRRPETWRGASIWDSPDGQQALVPAGDGLDDAADRTWELLHTLAQVEGRPSEDIAEDIASPAIDAPYIRTFPAELPSGQIGLVEALQALDGVRNILAAAGRAEIEEPRITYSGRNPPELTRLLREIRLGPTKPGSYTFTLRAVVTPPDQASLLGDAEPLVRRTLRQLHRGVSAAHRAVTAIRQGSDYSEFDAAVGDGLSAPMCHGLSDLAGPERQQPFEIGFRWARATPVDLPGASLRFGAGAGVVMREAGKQLEQLAAGGRAEITGLIESLHDEPLRDDRWRVQVRGQLSTTDATLDPARPVWVRLTAASYESAIDAHRQRRPVRAQGHLQLVRRRVELRPDDDGFDIL